MRKQDWVLVGQGHRNGRTQRGRGRELREEKGWGGLGGGVELGYTGEGVGVKTEGPRGIALGEAPELSWAWKVYQNARPTIIFESEIQTTQKMMPGTGEIQLRIRRKGCGRGALVTLSSALLT